MMRSLYGRLTQVLMKAPATVGSGDGTTSSVDMQGFQSLMISIAVGVFNFTSTNKLQIIVKESDDNTTFTTVADADLEGIETTSVHRLFDASASDASTVTNLFYRGNKRYVQLALDESGTVAAPLSVVAILGDSHNKPSVD